MIEFIQTLKAQGTTLVVWSHAGVDWAEEVVNSLGLNVIVDCVMSKPTLMLDDKQIEHLGKTIWIGPKQA